MLSKTMSPVIISSPNTFLYFCGKLREKMGQSGSVDQLNTGLHVLRSKWAATKAEWNDAVSTSFEATYLLPINQQGDRTLAKMQELAKVLLEAQRRVE